MSNNKQRNIDIDQLIESWQTYVDDISEKKGSKRQRKKKRQKREQQQEEDGKMRTPIGKRIEKILKRADQPLEYIDFLATMRKIIESETFLKSMKVLGRKAEYDKGDIYAMMRLARAFEQEDSKEEEGASDEQQ